MRCSIHGQQSQDGVFVKNDERVHSTVLHISDIMSSWQGRAMHMSFQSIELEKTDYGAAFQTVIDSEHVELPTTNFGYIMRPRDVLRNVCLTETTPATQYDERSGTETSEVFAHGQLY